MSKSVAKPATLCEAFQRTAAVDPDAVALRAFGSDTAYTWREYASEVERIAGGLANLGVRRGDTVALMMTNRPEFSLCDAAAMHLGAIPFSIYNSSAVEQVAYILGNASSGVVICDRQFVEKIKAAGGVVQHLLCVEDGDLNSIESDPTFDFEASWKAVQRQDVLTLIYTSGTTGPPKGVEITHSNVLANGEALVRYFDIRSGDRVISYLPSAHIADRTLSHYNGLLFGLGIVSLADMALLPAALSEVHPTGFAGVPRVWEKLKVGIETVLSAKPDLASAVAAGDAGVIGAIRAKVGLDQVRWAMSGAAAIAPDVHEFFMKLGLPVNEIWGMSECLLGSASPSTDIRVGTVGKVIPEMEWRLEPDGELCVRGPSVMKGYLDDPERTAEAIDPDGWLHTGDIVEADVDGYVKIVDRKKELIINSGGKNMSPANIRNAIKTTEPLIAEVMVVGDQRPYNVALIVLDQEVTTKFAAEQGIDPDPAVLAKDDKVRRVVQAGVDAGNATLSRIEQIKRFTILPMFWMPGGDELTPTLKLRRKNIAEKYAAEIDGLYAETKQAARA